MVKPNPPRGTRGRDTEDPGAPIRVSEDAQARNMDHHAARLFESSQQKRDQLPERPSTSAGPASTFTKRRNAEKRETKDDLYFNPLAARGVGTTFYNFPLPGSLPTPASSPKSPHHPAARKPQVTCPSTPESMKATPAAKMNVPEAEIGMALGSPQHPPAAWQQTPMDRYTESPDHIDADFSNSAPVKQKTSKWKILGGLFGGKKQEAQPASFYQLQPETTQHRPLNHGFDFGEPSEKPKSRGRGRSNSSAKKSRKHKPEMSRSKTAPLSFDLEGSDRQRQTGTPEITLGGRNVVYDGSGPRSTQKGAGLLDVDIPSVRMERYSIMFNSVLQKPRSQSSSLLARRQATLDNLKTVDEALASKEHELEAKSEVLLPRRATSPGFKAQSPAFSLFPSTPRTRDASPSSRSRRSVTIQRSNTSPAALSPIRPSFAPGINNEGHADLVDSPAVPMRQKPDTRQHPDMYRSPRALRKKEESKAAPGSALESNKWSPEQSHLLLDSSSDNEMDKEDDIPLAVAVPMKPKLPEPNWQMVNPTHATNDSVSGSSTSESDHSLSTSASSITTPLSTSTAPYPVVKPLRINSPPQIIQAQAVTIAQKPAMTRSRGADPVAAPSSIPRRNANAAVQVSSPTSEEDEARLEPAADVLIARQISVSRRQRQLLVPIRTSLKPPSRGNLSKKYSNPAKPNESPKKDRVVGGSNPPSPASGIGAIGKVTSPLGAIATATKEKHERGHGSPQAGRITREKSPTERLVQVAKPSTPILVVVGESADGRGKAWGEATANMNLSQSHAPVGFSERRRQKEAAASHKHANPNIGVIRAGVAVSRDSSPARQARELSHRKSERVVVERIGVASN